MARKKRGGKAAANRKAKNTKVVENVVSEETVTQSPTESEESCSSGTPKSCNTPIEIDKTGANSSTLVQHKKFGKFRCLLTDDVNKTEVSSSESEMQTDVLEVDPKDVEIITIETESIIEDLKSVEISETETLQDIPICTEEIVQEEIIEDISENILEITTSCDDIPMDNEVPIIETEIKTDFTSCIQSSSEESQEQTVIIPPQDNISTDSIKPIEETDVKSQETDSDVKKSSSEADANSDSSSTTTVRRSSRIRSISVLKQRSKGHGLVKSDKLDKKEKPFKPTKNVSCDLESISENSNSNTASSEKVLTPLDSPSFVAPAQGAENELKPVKVKSRWRRSSELEMGGSSPLTVSSYLQTSPQVGSENSENPPSSGQQNQKDESPEYDEEMENRLRQFQTLTENQYLTERTSCKEAKKMVCDCFLTKEEIERGEFGCGEDCLNRLLMIECGSQCNVGERCTNKRFQKLQYSNCEVFRTEKKGFGIRATANISYGDFILEYVGEVLDPDEFDKRAKEYSKDKNRHYYFMALRADAVIDATQKGNISRFINHSCDPNAETQKWTVNGELRIGFFSKRTIIAGEEITFDYQFQRYGKEAQKCYCESSNCRGWIGEEPEEDDDEEDDEEDSEREEENEEDETKESDSAETDVKEAKAVVKRQVRRRRLIKKQRKDIFEDLDLDEEIGMLSTTGVKNQAHTLKLSRLMVRAKDVGPRMQLLKLLREGDLPCRRLFLDYHGLRLIHGWMGDASCMTDSENKNDSFRIEILQTLATLPIPNKTMLQDSKVLSTVEKWSCVNKIEVTQSPADSASNSPQIDSASGPTTNQDTVQKELKPADSESMEIVETVEDEQVKMEVEKEVDFSEDIKIEEMKSEIKQEDTEIKELVDEEAKVEVESVPQEPEEKDKIEEVAVEEHSNKQEESGNEKLIYELTTELLSKWILLKEVFRIPKKERIEQMKEHEREADRDYKADLNLEQESDGKRDARYSWKSDRYRIVDKDRRKSKEILEHERDRNTSKKGIRLEERNIVPIPKLSKHERRQLFALQVAQEEEGRRRKHEQEMWRMHEQRCMVMGADPRLTNIDMNPAYPCYWNPNTGQWQNYPGPGVVPGQQPPPMFDMNCVPRPPVCQTAPPPHMPMMMPPMPAVPPNRPPILQQPYQPPPGPVKEEVAFTAPPPPPVKLPPKWKCARDKYGRPYYYHIKVRLSQWEPPEFPPPVEEIPNELIDESSSSSESSSVSSDSSTDSDEDSEMGDTKLLLEIRSKLKHIEAKPQVIVSNTENVTIPPVSLEVKTESPKSESFEDTPKPVETVPKRKREGLVQEIIISPRREEDKIAHKAELKRYKETKEKLRRQKQLLLEQTKKRLKGKLGKGSSSKSSKKHRSSKLSKLKSLGSIDMNSEEAKKIKELFRSSMASVMVQNLNAYRKPDCKMGRITNTDDFKHLARKLTHFVMLKELKHCQSIEELTCNESVKAKAKDFVKKYMAKFGETYSRPKDEID